MTSEGRVRSLDVACPRCLVPAGWGCSDDKGRWQPAPHRERKEAAHVCTRRRWGLP